MSDIVPVDPPFKGMVRRMFLHALGGWKGDMVSPTGVGAGLAITIASALYVGVRTEAAKSGLVTAIVIALAYGLLVLLIRLVAAPARILAADLESERKLWGQTLNKLESLRSEHLVLQETIDRQIDVRVIVSTAYVDIPYFKTNAFLQLTAQNHGTKMVILDSFGVRLPDGRTMFTAEPNPLMMRLPKELQPGDNFAFGWEKAKLSEGLKEERVDENMLLRGVFTDKLGRSHFSDPFPAKFVYS